MSATKAPTKGKKSKKKGLLDQWADKYFNSSTATKLTSEELAAIASKSLGETVSPARLVRVLDRRGILFARAKSDPAKQGRTRIDLLNNRLRTVEERLNKLEAAIAS